MYNDHAAFKYIFKRNNSSIIIKSPQFFDIITTKSLGLLKNIIAFFVKRSEFETYCDTNSGINLR